VKSTIASLRSLTLPFGATSGGRIVLDGVNGRIEVYDSDGQLIGTFDPNGLVYLSSVHNPARIFQYDPSSNVQTIFIDDGTETPSIILDGRGDTQGVWVTAADGSFLRLAADINGIPDIVYGTSTGTVLTLPTVNSSSGSYAEFDDPTPITSDIDIRMEVQTNDWTPVNARALIQKWEIDPGSAWIFLLESGGKLQFSWNQLDGSLRGHLGSTVAVSPPGDGHMAVRVTADMDNAGVAEIKYYTATTIAGPWTQLGTTITGSTTSTGIFNSVYPIRIGRGVITEFVEPVWAWDGDVYAAEIRDGIGGTVVANPDFTIQQIGTIAFTDAAGSDWTIHGGAQITNISSTTRSYPRGVPNGGFLHLATNDVARAANTNTDMSITFDAFTTRLYRVHLDSRFTVGTAAATYVLLLRDSTAATNDRILIRVNPADCPAGSVIQHVSSSVLWTPPASGARTLAIRNGGSGGTVTMEGAAAGDPRSFWIEDIGAV
jgi:hypothetical protein